MKAILLKLILLMFLLNQALGQVIVKDGLYFNKAGRQVWISTINGEKTPRSLLFKVSQDSIFYVETKIKTLTPQHTDLEIKRLHFSQLDTLVTLKNKPVAKGALSGGLIGFAMGVVISAASYEPAPDPISQVLVAASGGESTFHFGAGLLVGTLGAGVGAGIGAIAKKKWKIKGRESEFEKALLDLDRRAYWNRSRRPK